MASIKDAVRQAYAEAGFGYRDKKADAICLALAGIDAFDELEWLRNQFDFAQVSIYSDIDATVAGALGNSDGIVAGIGTGSFFVSRLNGSIRRVGGHGFQISDECSAAWLGRELLRFVVQSRDGLIERTPIVDKIFETFDCSVKNLVKFSLAAGPRDFGRLARFVTEAADDGDPVAIQILNRAVVQFCRILEFLDARSIGLICISGGLGPTYRSLLSKTYGELLADPAGDALDGAYELLTCNNGQAIVGR